MIVIDEINPTTTDEEITLFGRIIRQAIIDAHPLFGYTEKPKWDEDPGKMKHEKRMAEKRQLKVRATAKDDALRMVPRHCHRLLREYWAITNRDAALDFFGRDRPRKDELDPVDDPDDA